MTEWTTDLLGVDDKVDVDQGGGRTGGAAGVWVALGVVVGGADVAGAVWGPGDGVDGGLVAVELYDWEGWEADVEDDHLG
ncbi:hypothetical protein Scep_025930 [Stephania cephalantha]|uniref:Uncharacterized protein n=1 Tax=Stephania cephalantha TaxID=152367 RepID=A0AAP0EJ58_9MAGN